MSSFTITYEPADKKAGMTLDELGSFVQEAHRAGVDGGVKVETRVGFRQQITNLTVKAEK